MSTTTHEPPSTPIRDAVAKLGDGPLDEARIREHVRPLFSRALAREEIYLANHSLGRPLDQTAEDVRAAIDAWYTDMDGAWSLWMEEIARFRTGIATLIGCGRPDLIVPKATAAQGLRAVLNALPAGREPRPVRVVTTTGEFDSIDFVLKAYAARGRAHVRFVEPDGTGLFEAERIGDALTAETDLLVVSQVFFAMGQRLGGLGDLIRRAHDAGAHVLLDTYHSAGAGPVGFDDLGADFAIGGSYKYTRGGAGAGFLALHERHTDRTELAPIDTGWFAKADVFGFQRDAEPRYASGGDGWMEATPAVLPFFQARAGLEFTNAIGPDRLCAFNTALQDELAKALAGAGVPTRLIPDRGAFLLVPVDDPRAAIGALKAVGVNADARPGPDGNAYVRLCPDLLNTREELREAATRVAGALAAR